MKMKKISALLMSVILLLLSGCGDEGQSDIMQTTTVLSTTASYALEGEPIPEKVYSEEIQQLMEAVKFDGVYCEQEFTRIRVERIKPDYAEILGILADPSTYIDEENGATAEGQALQYIEDMVQYRYAYNGRLYFSVAEENTFSIYSINAYTEDVEKVFTADTMGYNFCWLIEVNGGGVVWRCADVADNSIYNEGGSSIYCQQYGGMPYCLDSFFNEHPSINTIVPNYVFDDDKIYYVDQLPIAEFGGKSDYVPCVMEYKLAGGSTKLYEYNAWNVRRRNGSISYDSCDPNELGFPYTDEYAVHTKYDTPFYDMPMYQYTEHIDGYDGEVQYGYLLEGENYKPIKLFVIRVSRNIGRPIVTKGLAVSGYLTDDRKSYMAVMDYIDQTMCAVPMDIETYGFGTPCSDSAIIYVPQNDGSIITIRRV